MRLLIAVGALLLLAACTPGDEQYCNRMGVAGTSEFGNCLQYYHTQEALFGNDRMLCEMEADGLYPPTLYDNGHYEHIPGAYVGGVFYGGQTVRVEPDYQHNAEVDRLRMTRVIEPCMQSKGWNSGSTWQAGRHAVVVAPATMKPAMSPAPAGNALPWLR